MIMYKHKGIQSHFAYILRSRQMNVNVALLEDEQSEREHTVSMLKRFFAELNIELSLTCYSDAQSFLGNGSNFKDFQLLLMDIILPDGQPNGMELAREVRKVNRDVAIMFITKTVQFAINGYEVDAVDYVLKPLVYEDFALKLKKAMRYIMLHTEKFIVLNHKEGTTRIGESKIYYIEVMLHYLIVHTAKGDFTVRGSIKDMESQLSKSFCRCANSFIVNLRHIDGVKDNFAIVRGQSVPITKTRRAAFLNALNAYNGVM